MTAVRERIAHTVTAAVDAAAPLVRGRVSEVRGLSVSVSGAPTRIGELVLIGTEEPTPAEVVAVQGDLATCLPLGSTRGIGAGDPVTATGRPMVVHAGTALLGRVLDGMGRPMDGRPLPTGLARLPVEATPPDALTILQAAQKLNIEGNVKLWGCSTPCNTDFLAKALGPKWNHKLFVNAELTDPDDHNGPEMQNYKAMLAKYGSNVAGGIGSFSQMGYVLAKFLVQALQTVHGPYTIKSVNQAILNIKDYKTEMICEPWTYGKVALHIPNNTDYTTTPENGKMVTAQGCTQISAADPQIAQYHAAATAAGIS